MTQDKIPILSRDPVTGDYVADFRIQVPAELFQRLFFRAVEEDGGVDLTNTVDLTSITARVGNVANWLGKPHVKVTPIPTQMPVKTPTPVVPKETQTAIKPKRGTALTIERLRESASHIAPHLWEEQCRTPIGALSLPKVERENIGRLRYDEKQILKELYEEWQQGKFTLDPEAAEQERQYQESQQANLNVKLETVASTVNGSRIR